ncbi:hypothetical protein [Streptomyces sp. P17]|uniref:hypothetical protein n=1 Tax=Streptomyces sp. P17 TaxID=3074716 RepID=UPI0028F42754|nr:hypothetical protein [Streptomyces sp. P17]MDT9699021.1 hypothetical protein [Streptomyces sp. P17]
MTLSAALPGAALRMVRKAAGRRALYLALLVGGLFALGILGGQQAQAAEDAPAALSVDVYTPVERMAESVVQEPQVQQPAPSKPSVPEAADGDRILRPVHERAARPVGEVVGAVTDGLGDVRDEVPPLSSLPTLPELPQSPGRPGLPVLPGLPEPPVLPGLPEPPVLPGLPEPPVLPGLELPALPGQTPPAPAATAPQPGPVASSSVGEEDSEGPSKKAAAYGPRDISSYDITAPRAFAHPRRADSVEPVPARHAPAGDPGGALDHHATIDNSTPRHGDAQAVALNHRAPPRLVPGAAARVSADETRDEYRDIPVSPA